MSTFSSDDVFEDSLYDEDDVYDDPYEVVMYDIDGGVENDVHALLNMLTDDDRSWYAKRRLSVLASSGPLSALVARVIIDSLGRRWDPLLHPRDRFGRFIETGGFFRWFMKGAWSRGQVVRIDSDGVIHARSDGNDGIPDGTPIKFSNKHASKLISTASDKASLSGNMPDFDAEIPGYPEASPTQRRIYNLLAYGDMPGQDLYGYRAEEMSGTEFGNEITDLVRRDLMEITKGDKPRARRTDQDELGVIDMDDDEIDEVPDDETPDLDDSPELTKAQRDLYDQLVEMDSGEGDGIGPEELADVNDEDLDALIEAGVLDADGERYNLVNPETTDEAVAVDETAEPEPDVETQEPELDAADAMDRAAQAAFPDDVDMQDAFLHHANELAFEDYDGELPPDVRPAAARRAKAAADAWWEEFNAPEAGADVPETDVPEPAEQPVAVKKRNEYRAEAQDLLGQYEFPEDYLDSPEGEKYIQAVTDLLYVADLEAAGEDTRADLNRQLAENKLRDIGISEEDIAGWDAEIKAFRDEHSIPDAPETEEVNAPEAEVVEDIAETDVPETDVPETDVPSAEAREQALRDAGLSEAEIAEIQEDIAQAESEQPIEDVPDPVSINEVDEDFLQQGLDEQQAIDDAAEDASEAENPWDDFARRLDGEEPAANFADRLEQERRIANELGLDAEDDDAPWTWNSFANAVGEERARELFIQNDGELGRALANNEDDANRAPAVDAPEDDVDESAAVGSDLQPQESDLVSSADNPAFQKILDDPEFWEDKPDFKEGAVVLDRSGNEMVVGGWYKAEAGGEGDFDQFVGAPDQQKYPGLAFVQTPDGKMKIVVANNPNNRDAGINRVFPDEEELANARVQRAVAADRVLPLDQNNPRNLIDQKEPGVVGMRVGGKGATGQFQEGDEGIIVRISGWDKKNNRPFYWVRKANDPNGKEFMVAPARMSKIESAPEAPSNLVDPGVLNAPDGAGPNVDIAPGVWGRPRDGGEVEALVQELGGEVDYVDFLNGFAEPGNAAAILLPEIENGRFEIIPGEGTNGRPRLRLPDGDAAPEAPALPDGAENEFEADILNHLDGLGGAGDLRGNMIDIDDADAVEKLSALRALVDRGVVEEFDNLDNGLKYFRRVPPSPDSPGDAENEVEADILSAIDGLDRPANRSDLLDPDAPDFDERMEALRALVDRGVLRQSTDPETGKLIFRRPSTGGSSPAVPMTEEEAVSALRSGADPILIANPNLDAALRRAGFRYVRNGAAGISPNNWVMSEEDAPFAIKIPGGGRESKKVYMVKESGGLKNDMINEVMAGAISADVLEKAGRDDDNGPLFHPRVGMAKAPRGLGRGAGGAIIMDHAAYGYPEGYEFRNGSRWDENGVDDDDIDAGGASGDVIMLGLYDYMINNTIDRHSGNQMYAKDPTTGKIRVVVIDNGFGFAGGGEDKNRSFQSYATSGQPKGLFRRANRSDRAVVVGAVQRFVDNYSQLDVESAMTRIRTAYPDITPEQEEYAREWLDTAKARVDILASDIDSVVSVITNL